ncbi:MAG: nicotinate (nicotinamide) nucleotide adenylyltransferase [Spirochaetales bacterium]|nr:nicotinate (nicotinamide) nucleotide adenylyltransferase [Spirochaetales bacterium]
MKTAILGGTFNPPHWGHLMLAELAYCEAGYEQLLLVPTRKPAHKVIAGATDEQRLTMLSLALENFSVPGLKIAIETCELYRPGVSYSIDTVACVEKLYTLDGKPGLLLGDDLFETFDQWKDAPSIAEKADLWVARRKYNDPLPSKFFHQYFRNPIVGVSSSEIRERVARSDVWRALLPPSVARYVTDQGLYREGKS